MLDQFLISSVIKQYLQQHYPQLLTDLNDRPDGSFECQQQSPSKHFSIWIATYNCEITLGIASPDGDSGCHTHFTPYTVEDFPYVLEGMSDLLRDIMTGVVVFYHSSIRGYTWTDDMEAILSKKKPGETILVFSWSGKE